jgi:hypothetical protein
MTQNKDRKGKIRARMAATGEPYTEAARQVGRHPVCGYWIEDEEWPGGGYACTGEPGHRPDHAERYQDQPIPEHVQRTWPDVTAWTWLSPLRLRGEHGHVPGAAHLVVVDEARTDALGQAVSAVQAADAVFVSETYDQLQAGLARNISRREACAAGAPICREDDGRCHYCGRYAAEHAEHFPGCHPEHANADRQSAGGHQPQETEACWHCGTPTTRGCSCADCWEGADYVPPSAVYHCPTCGRWWAWMTPVITELKFGTTDETGGLTDG